MRKRWTAAGMLVAEQQFRRIIGYRDLSGGFDRRRRGDDVWCRRGMQMVGTSFGVLLLLGSVTALID